MTNADWFIHLPENDSCAVVEGFATYIAGVSWYDPNTATTTPQLWGVDFETNSSQDTSSCAANRGIPLQTTKGFWDVADQTNEAGFMGQPTDSQWWFSTWIVRGWNYFPNGTANRQNDEASIHGVNLRDYYANTFVGHYSSSAGLEDTLVRHNCAQTQAP